MLYANKKFLVHVNRALSDGMLHTRFGDSVPVKAGEIICHDQEGNGFVITQQRFDELYIPVEKVQRKVSRQLSPFEEQYYTSLFEEVGKLNQTEDEQYITGTQALTKNKAF